MIWLFIFCIFMRRQKPTMTLILLWNTICAPKAWYILFLCCCTKTIKNIQMSHTVTLSDMFIHTMNTHTVLESNPIFTVLVPETCLSDICQNLASSNLWPVIIDFCLQKEHYGWGLEPQLMIIFIID